MNINVYINLECKYLIKKPSGIKSIIFPIKLIKTITSIKTISNFAEIDSVYTSQV